MIGTRLADYEVLRELGEGGMGRIFLARNVYLNDMYVVLKILKDREQEERFRGEGTNLLRLEHPSICQLKGYTQHDSNVVLIVQYIDGENLEELLQRWEKVDLLHVKDIYLQVLDGLAYAHTMGVQHRDLKPSNIMIDKQNRVKLIDFGIARHTGDVRHTRTGSAIGTPRYMAPEQFASEKLTDFTSCDIYSLGICIFETCCKRPPFEETNPFVLAQKHQHVAPPRPSSVNNEISPEFESFIMKAIEKKPSRRFQSATEMRAALLGINPIAPRPSTTLITSRIKTRKHISAVLSALVVVALIIIAANYTFWPSSEPIPVSNDKINWAALRGQTIEEGQDFLDMDLLKLFARPADSETYTFQIQKPSSLLAVQKGLSVSLKCPDDDWSGTDSLTIRALSSGGSVDSFTYTFAVSPINDAPAFTRTDAIQLATGESKSLEISSIFHDVDDPLLSLNISVGGSSHLSAVRRQSRIIVSSLGNWQGSDSILISATDPAGARTDGYFRVESKTAAMPTIATVSSPEPEKPLSFSTIIRVQQSAAEVRQVGGASQPEPWRGQLASGEHTFMIYHPEYPIKTVRVKVWDAAIDTMISLSEGLEVSKKGDLAPVVHTSSSGDLSEVIYINGKRTEFTTVDQETPSRPPGDYLVAVRPSSNVRLDSVKVDDKLVPRSFEVAARVRVNDVTSIEYFVTKD